MSDDGGDYGGGGGGDDYGGDTGCSFETFDAAEDAGNYESNDYGGGDTGCSFETYEAAEDAGNYESNDYGGGGDDTAVCFETFDAEGVASNDNEKDYEGSSFYNNINSERVTVSDSVGVEMDCVAYNTYHNRSSYTTSYRPRTVPYIGSNRRGPRSTTYVTSDTSETTGWAIFVGVVIFFVFLIVLIMKR